MKNRPFKPRRRIEKDIGLQAHVLNGAGNELTAHPYVVPRTGEDGKLDASFLPAGAVAAHHITHENGGTDEILVTGLSGQLADAQPVAVRKNTGANVGTRARLNLIEGANITLTVADDGVDNEVDVTITGSAGGSGITAIQKDDVDVVNPAATIDFLGTDFAVTSGPATEGNVSINRNVANGIAGLDAGALLPTAQLPTVPIANGGTGQITATLAFNALDPLTTKGDIIVHDGTNSTRLSVGADGTIPIADATQPVGIKWGAVPAASTHITSITQNLTDTARTAGSFVITDAALLNGELLMITQAAGPYTGKGTKEDEAEMDGVVASGFVAAGGGSATVYWNSATQVVGKFKFNYLHGS